MAWKRGNGRALVPISSCRTCQLSSEEAEKRRGRIPKASNLFMSEMASIISHDLHLFGMFSITGRRG